MATGLKFLMYEATCRGIVQSMAAPVFACSKSRFTHDVARFIYKNLLYAYLIGSLCYANYSERYFIVFWLFILLNSFI